MENISQRIEDVVSRLESIHNVAYLKRYRELENADEKTVEYAAGLADGYFDAVKDLKTLLGIAD